MIDAFGSAGTVGTDSSRKLFETIAERRERHLFPDQQRERERQLFRMIDWAEPESEQQSDGRPFARSMPRVRFRPALGAPVTALVATVAAVAVVPTIEVADVWAGGPAPSRSRDVALAQRAV